MAQFQHKVCSIGSRSSVHGHGVFYFQIRIFDQILHMYKFLRYVAKLRACHKSSDFIFADHQPLENLLISYSFLISDTYDSQSFANEISRMKIFRKAS